MTLDYENGWDDGYGVGYAAATEKLGAVLRTIASIPPQVPGTNADGTVSTTPLYMTLAREALGDAS